MARTSHRAAGRITRPPETIVTLLKTLTLASVAAVFFSSAVFAAADAGRPAPTLAEKTATVSKAAGDAGSAAKATAAADAGVPATTDGGAPAAKPAKAGKAAKDGGTAGKAR